MAIQISEIQAKSILRKQKKVESWFVSRYGMNLYRGCTHNCSYCDGRAEKYQVTGEFGSEIAVKTNAIEILERELDPARKRKPMKPGFIFVGGGVCDSYQPAEGKYKLTRRALKLIARYDFPVHMLTKSMLIERDMDILSEIRQKSNAIISMSFSSTDDHINAHFEPGVTKPSRRLKTLELFKSQGFAVGMYLMPVVPFITDTPEKIQNTVRDAVNAGVDFIVFGGMTMKVGRQQDHFFDVLKEYDDSLVDAYDHIYSSSEWGQASGEYYQSINDVFSEIAAAYKIPVRIPPHIWDAEVDENDRVIIILEHIDYLLKLRGGKSHYNSAAYSISQQKETLSSMREKLEQLKGIGVSTARLVREVLDTGSSTYYRWLLFGAEKTKVFTKS
jgi:DNA repair photolyase